MGWTGLLGALVLLLAAGCGSEAPEATSEAVEPPPSIRAEEAGTVQQIRLDDRQQQELNVQTVSVGRADVYQIISLPGEVLPAPENFAIVSAPISGRVVRIYAHEGEAVRQGQPLLEMESLEFANLAAEYLQAKAEATYQASQVDRLQTLVERKISPRSALEKAQADLSRAQTSVSATYARLKAVGVPDQMLEGWSTTTTERPLLPVYAPISGIIDQHDVELGTSVTSYQQMLSLINPSRVLVRGFVSPEDAPLLRSGDAVRIGGRRVAADAVEAQITTINPALDEANKSVVVNILANTRNGWPMPGQTVQLQIRASTPRPVITLPLSAVQYEGERPTVFVQIDPATYEKRLIEIDRIDEDQVIVASGLEEGEAVAVSQVFSLKALSRFEQYGEE